MDCTQHPNHYHHKNKLKRRTNHRHQQRQSPMLPPPLHCTCICGSLCTSLQQWYTITIVLLFSSLWLNQHTHDVPLGTYEPRQPVRFLGGNHIAYSRNCLSISLAKECLQLLATPFIQDDKHTHLLPWLDESWKWCCKGNRSARSTRYVAMAPSGSNRPNLFVIITRVSHLLLSLYVIHFFTGM